MCCSASSSLEGDSLSKFFGTFDQTSYCAFFHFPVKPNNLGDENANNGDWEVACWDFAFLVRSFIFFRRKTCLWLCLSREIGNNSERSKGRRCCNASKKNWRYFFFNHKDFCQKPKRCHTKTEDRNDSSGCHFYKYWGRDEAQTLWRNAQTASDIQEHNRKPTRPLLEKWQGWFRASCGIGNRCYVLWKQNHWCWVPLWSSAFSHTLRLQR